MKNLFDIISGKGTAFSSLFFIVLFLISSPSIRGEVIISDFSSDTPLVKASIFDKNGVFIAVTDEEGKIPNSVSSASYPLNIRYVGYSPIEVTTSDSGILKMHESSYLLPEITVDNELRDLLYIKAYERNYQNAVDLNDTVTYFTERIVDFVIPMSKKSKHKGWKKGRVLGERIYSHIKQQRKDRSRDTLRYEENRYNKSYGYMIDNQFIVPEDIRNGKTGKVIIQGKYSPKDVWTKVGDNLVLLRDNLSDKKNHVNSPASLKLLGAIIDVTREEYLFHFSPDSRGKISADMISEAAYFHDIYLKGKLWKKFTEQKQDIPMQSYGELYVIDHQYLTANEAEEMKKNPPSPGAAFTAPKGISAPPANIVKLKEDVKKKYPEAR